MGECESTCHILMWFQVYIWAGGGIRVCVSPNVLRKEDTVPVKYLCHHKKRIICLYIFDRILIKRIINNNIVLVF